VVKQSVDFSCGAAALATLINRFGVAEVGERELLDLLLDQHSRLALPPEWRETGMSFATLAAIAEHYGLAAVGIELSASDLAQLRTPALAYLPHSDPPHFTVVTGITARHGVELADPSWGRRRLRSERFNALWLDTATSRGRLMVLHPQDSTQALPAMTFTRPVPLVRPPGSVRLRD
jgi:predicted double-glycine peptidase